MDMFRLEVSFSFLCFCFVLVFVGVVFYSYARFISFAQDKEMNTNGTGQSKVDLFSFQLEISEEIPQARVPISI